MNQNEHLTEQQLLDYSADRLEGEEENTVSRHLLMCEECRNRMPPPTAEQFLRAIFGVGKDDSEFTEEDISSMAANWRGRKHV